MEQHTPSEVSPARKVAVTGATGQIGRELVDALIAAGYDPILLGRDPAAMSNIWPELRCENIHDAESVMSDADWLVHLAARNNDTPGTREEFFDANLELTKLLFCVDSKNEGRTGKIFFSSTRARQPAETDYYGQSKRAAESWLLEQGRPEWHILRLPAVHQNDMGGRYTALDRLPGFLRPTGVVSALRQQVHIDSVIETVLATIGAEPGGHQQPVVELADNKSEDRLYGRLKWLMDFTFAITILTLFSWLMILIWITVRLSSPGPGIFAQERVGRYGKSFTCYKFRTMREGSKVAASHEVQRSSVTRIGNILRATKLDELPQAINLLRGEMSLVGPRPCLPIQEELIEARRKRGVLDVVPGITGWAQINDVDMSDPQRLAIMDAEYVARRSLIFDFKILLATFTGSGLSDRTAKD